MALQPYTITTQKPSPYQSIIEEWTRKESEAYAANLARQKEIEAIYDKMIAMYGPGGTYGAGMEAELAKQKVRDVGVTAQRDISRGMYGIRPYEQEWESAVGAPARLKLEDIKTERLSAALGAKAGFEERIEQPYPDYSAMAQMMVAGYGGEMGGGISYGARGASPAAAQFGGYSQWTATPAEMSYGPEYAASMEEKSAAAESIKQSMVGVQPITPTTTTGGGEKKQTINDIARQLMAKTPGLSYDAAWNKAKSIFRKGGTATTTPQMQFTSGGSFGGGYTYR